MRPINFFLLKNNFLQYITDIKDFPGLLVRTHVITASTPSTLRVSVLLRDLMSRTHRRGTIGVVSTESSRKLRIGNTLLDLRVRTDSLM